MSHESAIQQFTGAYSALITPFCPKNQIDFEMLEQIVRFQLDEGLKGFFVAGTTGEGLLLSFEERIELTRQVVRICREYAQSSVNSDGNPPTVIAHVGHPDTSVAAKLASESAKTGVDWIGSVGPIFYGNSFEGTLRHYRMIAEASELPFMIYAFQAKIDPQRDGQLFGLPNVSGIKFTGADFFSIQQLARHLDSPVALISGMDEQFVAGQTMGFQAGIGSTYNFAPRFYADIYQLCQQNDFQAAARIQAEINKVTYLMTTYENWTYRKAIMRYIGFDCGSYRPPFAPISEQEYQAFAKKLDALGVLGRVAESSVNVANS